MAIDQSGGRVWYTSIGSSIPSQRRRRSVVGNRKTRVSTPIYADRLGEIVPRNTDVAQIQPNLTWPSEGNVQNTGNFSKARASGPFSNAAPSFAPLPL